MASAWSTTPGSRIDKVDARLSAALEKAAQSFAQKNPGYRVEGFSGQRPRATTKNHPAGRAIDVNIYDPNGNKLGNVKNAATFGIYEKLAHEFRTAMDEAGLKDLGRWGGYFKQGVAFDQMHFDLGPRNAMAYGTWEGGLNEAGKKALPGAESAGYTRGMGLAALVDPNGKVSRAFNDPSRALDVPQMSPAQQYRADALTEYGQTRALNEQPPSYSQPNPGALRGRPLGALPSQLGGINMANPNFAAPPGMIDAARRERTPSAPSLQIGSAPVGQVTRAPLGPALARPSPPGNFAQGAPVSYGAPKANRLGGMDYAVAPERFDRPSVPSGIDRPGPPTSRPSLSAPPGLDRPGPVASRPSLSSPVGIDRPGVPTSRPSLATPVGLDRPGPPAQAPAPSQASVMGALSQRAGLEAIKDDSLAGPVTAPAINPAIANIPNRPLHQVVPPVAVPAPNVLTNYPVANIPAAQNIGPPRENFAYTAPTASDVYSGKSSVGYDSVGNRVSSLPGGVTSVTNKYGATTGMTPGGYQTAVGSMPSIPGMSMPSKSTVGGAVKGGALGASVGGPVGGLIGALAGALAAKAMAERNGTASATTGQSGGGLGGLFSSIFGGNTASRSGSSSGKSGSSSSGSSGVGSYGKSGSGSYGTNPNSKSLRI